MPVKKIQASLTSRIGAIMAVPLLAGAILAGPAAAAPAKPQVKTAAAAQVKTGAISVTLDGKKLPLKSQPIQSKGYILVPMKDIFNSLGASVTWEPNTKTIIATSHNYLTMTLQVGASHAVVNGKNVKLDVPAALKNGVTYVPIRFVSESFGAIVKWDGASRAVRIQSAESQMEEARIRAEKERQANRLTTAEIVAKNDDSVVLIQTDFGQGSGVVVDSHAVLTNHHVMQEAKSGKVIMNDGRELTIRGVASYDEKNDLAIIVTEEDLDVPAVDFGKLDDMEKGDSVVAIGSPLGVQNTVTEGVISNFGYDNGSFYYQISNPIDHGSSGGGLFNQFGELIGLTTSGYEDTAANINFAVSSEDAMSLLWETDLESEQISFLKSSLPDTLEGASNEEIVKLLKKEFNGVPASDGMLELSDWKVSRDEAGWLQLTANVHTGFYDVYGSKMEKNLRLWAFNTYYDLHRLLPKEKIQLNLYYDKKVDFEPRGYAPGVVTALPDGKWQVRYSILDVQFKDEVLIKIPS